MKKRSLGALALVSFVLALVGCQNPAVGAAATPAASSSALTPPASPAAPVTPLAGTTFAALNNSSNPVANYNFDGGILSARTFANDSAAVISVKSNGPDYALTNGAPLAAGFTGAVSVPITGIVTGWTNSLLYLQDKNAGIALFYHGTDNQGILDLVKQNNLNLGVKVTVTNAVAANNYYGLLEIGDFGSTGTDAPAITVVNIPTNPVLYYVPAGTAPWTDQTERLVQYQGTISLAPSLGDTYTSATSGVVSQYFRGSFDAGATAVTSQTAAAFQANASMVASLGTTSGLHYFYGPLTLVDAWAWIPSTSTTGDTKDPVTGGYIDTECILISSPAEIQ